MRHTKMKTIKIIKKVIFSIAIGFGAVMAPVSADDYGLLKLVTVGEGLQRVSHEALLAEGVNLSGLRHDRIVLMHAGDSIPVYSVGRLLEDGSHSLYFGAGAYFEYYVAGANSMYTDEQVVGLYVGTSRLDVEAIDASVVPGTSVATTYTATAVYDDNVNYAVTSPNLNDPWSMVDLRAIGRSASHDIAIDLPGILGSGEISISFEVWGQGSVDESPDHRVDMLVNGTSVLPAIAEFDFLDQVDLIGSLDAADLLSSGNTITVHLPMDQGAPYDLVSLNRLEINYPGTLQAMDGSLVFKADAEAALVAGLTSANVGVFEVLEDGTQTKLLAEIVDQLDGSFSAQFQTNIGARYIITSGATALTLEYLSEDEDISSGDAEYLVVAHENFINEDLDLLVNHRQARYSTKVVNVAQIYAQFGNARPDPTAIHDYIKYAVDNLNTEMVLFVGGDTYDYKGYVGDSISYIPTLYRPVDGGIVITHAPVDALYGDIDGDSVPDIPVGRLPLREPAELAIVVNKIIAYDARDKIPSSVFAADAGDIGGGYSFGSTAEELVESFPAEWKAANTNIFIDDYGLQGSERYGLANSDLTDAFNGGLALASYFGHSGPSRWSTSTPALLDTKDVMLLMNDIAPPLVAQWGCWNTYYVSPAANSMGHLLLVDGAHGAATLIGASTLTTARTERDLGLLFYPELFTPGRTLGEALINAKQAYAQVNPGAADVLIGYQIMGDPALILQPE